MSGAVASTYATLKSGLGNVTLSPLKTAYHFIFPPLEDLLIEHGGDYAAQRTRANEARQAAALEGGVVGASHRNLLNRDDVYGGSAGGGGGGSGSGSGSDSDDAIEAVWDGFSDSPWSFITSRYAIALFAMALITNRIQHICRPRGGRAVRLPQAKRLALRLPSILLLTRAVVILAVITSSLFFSESAPINRLISLASTRSWREAWLAYKPIGGWAQGYFGSESHDAIARARDAAALWASFTATCVAVVTESLIRSLEADREEAPSFNLVGFAFLLHFHSFSPEHEATKHVYLCILLQITEVLAVGLSKCRKRPLAPRLAVTSVFGITATVHYLLTLSDGTYPFMLAFSRAPEIALMVIVLLTVTLHALTMFLTGERVEMGRLLFNRSNMPSMSDDWSLALFKVGTACLESTRLTGLSQEVAPLQAYEGPFVEMLRNGNVRIIDADRGRLPEDARLSGSGDQLRHDVAGGLSREIKQVRVEDSAAARPSGLISSARLREAKRFLLQLYSTLRALMVLSVTKLCSAVGLPPPSVPQWVYRLLRRVRLLWHGRNGEERREQRLAEERRNRLSQESRRAYMAWVSGRDGSSATPGRLAARMRPRPRRIASADAVVASADGRSSAQQVGSARPFVARPRSRAASPSPSSSLLDAMLWQRFLAPDAPILEEDEEDEDDGEYADEGADSEGEELSSDEEEGGELQADRGSLDVGAQLARRADRLRAQAAAGDGIDLTADDEVEDDEQGPLSDGESLLLLAQYALRRDGPPLTRSTLRSLVDPASTSSAGGDGAAVLRRGSVDYRGGSEEESALLRAIAEKRLELESSRAASGGDVEAERRRLCVVCCVEER
ncbi:uncharacterized protein PFL1_04516 [Pseudozyma flocculosa PF-1]|uniref:Uncharacterized protein n=2 Tax=Pseudozyma flocculosa TaxID=84751 RepID=A0A061HAZ4_9BASI|nr:uncharacterized protein PFL1_04516 [Pseudozyma flocculosa PF-1]EPQ27771.1 hypothetical protein PFL1_04516 [Pseudozyma flocculosa PF-1]SPO41103.1 related to ASI1 - putative integral membrane E3 ubiquitin ligase [Pseudozyma flocculosa]